MRNYQHQVVDILSRRKFARTNFLMEALGGADNRRKDVYNFAKTGLLYRHPRDGGGKHELKYSEYWPYIYSLNSRQLNLNWHDMGVDDILLAEEIWAKKNNIPFKDSRDILQGRPLELSSHIKYHFKATKWRKEHDEQYDRPWCPDTLHSLGGLYFTDEYDRNTENIYASTFEDTKSWLRSLLQIAYVLKNKIYLKEWGIPNLNVRIITSAPTDTHLNNIMRFLGDELKMSAASIWFINIPVLSSTDKIQYPTPALPLFGEWRRVGHPPVNLESEVMKCLT